MEDIWVIVIHCVEIFPGRDYRIKAKNTGVEREKNLDTREEAELEAKIGVSFTAFREKNY